VARHGRSWGFWTQGKLDILRRYLVAFTVAASKKSREVIYLDLFAGEPENFQRFTGHPMEGSATIALRTYPQFTRLLFFELPPKATQLEAHLRARFPGRDIKAYEGDSNDTIRAALRDLESVRWAPTFAFIDPNGPDFHWATIRALAEHKTGSKNKVELWLLFPVGFFTRNLPTKGGILTPEAAADLTSMFGTGEWGEIYNDRLAGKLTGSAAAEEYLNLMRWRLESVLGYRRAHALEVKNEQGARLYDMIFATDNEAGDRIMTYLYNQALEDFPAMRRQALARHRMPTPVTVEVLELFDLEPYGPPSEPDQPPVSYRYEPPGPPYRSDP
jgi:three-Cys-motif partner protein